MEKKIVINIDIDKTPEALQLKIKVLPEIEAYFKKIAMTAFPKYENNKRKTKRNNTDNDNYAELESFARVLENDEDTDTGETENEKRTLANGKPKPPYIEQSEKWLDENGEGLQFYKTTKEFNDKISQAYSVFNNFGSGIINANYGYGTAQQKANIAILRAVGISEGDGITMKFEGITTFEEIKIFVDKLSDFTKAFYKDYLMTLKVRAKIGIES